MANLFISYRRDDSKHAVGRLHSALSEYFENPKEEIFVDVDSIPLGVRFAEFLDEKVGESDIVLVVIGPNWVQELNRRANDTDDFVRIEVSAALARGIKVVPVLLDGTSVPETADLPSDLVTLAKHHGTQLHHSSFRSDVDRLARGLGLTKKLKAPTRNAKAGSSSLISTLRNTMDAFGGTHPRSELHGNPQNEKPTTNASKIRNAAELAVSAPSSSDAKDDVSKSRRRNRLVFGGVISVCVAYIGFVSAADISDLTPVSGAFVLGLPSFVFLVIAAFLARSWEFYTILIVVALIGITIFQNKIEAITGMNPALAFIYLFY